MYIPYQWIHPTIHFISIFRHVPILGSFYNWISPVPEEAKVTVNSLNLYNPIQISHASKIRFRIFHICTSQKALRKAWTWLIIISYYILFTIISYLQLCYIEMLPKVKGRYLNLQEGKLETTEKMYKHHVMQVVAFYTHQISDQISDKILDQISYLKFWNLLPSYPIIHLNTFKTVII